MSHFVVVVVGENVKEQLESFWELDLSQEELLNDKRAVFIDKTKRVLEDYNSKDRDCSIDEYAEQEGYFKKDNKYGYYSNPNAKWDWYVIGGRWRGELKLKANTKIEGNNYGELGTFDSLDVRDGKKKIEELSPPTHCDFALKRQIDIAGMEEPLRINAERLWTEFHNLTVDKESDEYKSWLRDNLGFFSNEELKRLESMPKDEYIACKSTWAPYALLWNGKWYEKGTMGWWGVSSNEETQWPTIFKELWNQIPDNEMITVVDCHI
jgi:hypothetical protein